MSNATEVREVDEIAVIRKHIEDAELGEGHEHGDFESCEVCEQAQKSISYLQIGGWQNAIILLRRIDELTDPATTSPRQPVSAEQFWRSPEAVHFNRQFSSAETTGELLSVILEFAEAYRSASLPVTPELHHFADCACLDCHDSREQGLPISELYAIARDVCDHCRDYRPFSSEPDLRDLHQHNLGGSKPDYRPCKAYRIHVRIDRAKKHRPAKQCEFITKQPEHPQFKDAPCRNVTDNGAKYCPRHTAEIAQSEAASLPVQQAQPPTRPVCDYTGNPSLDPSQICRCGTCQLFVRILLNTTEGK